MTAGSPQPGEEPVDRYVLEELIATGGMGEVWRARDTMLGREVAVKKLLPSYADDQDFHVRFLTEARNAAGLLHPGIAAVFDYGEGLAPDSGDGHPVPYLVMEYVEGRPLSALLRERSPLDPDAAADLIGQAAAALGVAHAQGLVHRDVKPANLLVTPDGRVKVTDFGIARAADAAPLTRTGQLVGTPHYLSPEQAEGGSATPASDVYALGVVLFECLAGARPFHGDTPVGTALAHLREDVPPLPDDVPPPIAEVTRTALAKDPAQRYADGAQLSAALAGVRHASADAPEATALLTAPPVEAAQAPPPAATAGTVALSGGARRRLPPWWPLPLLAALALALVIALVAAGSDGRAGQPVRTTGPSSSPSTSTSPSSSPSPTPSSSPRNAVQHSTSPTQAPPPAPAKHGHKAKHPGKHGKQHKPGKHGRPGHGGGKGKGHHG